jgi:organic radical activating enzyme
MKTAFVSEIYPSIQGEGPYTGERQIFLRLAGCPLRCNYCDQPESLTPAGHTQMTTKDVLAEILRLKREQSISTVSATGGEPLVYAPFLAELFAALKKEGMRIYLETAGVHPEALETLVQFCDVVSMDMKLPSATGKSFWEEHRKFLRVGGEKVFTKVVVEAGSLLEEIEKCTSLLKEMFPVPLLVLQPASPIPPTVAAPSSEFLSRAYALAAARLPRVLVMPQQHKIWGVR